MLNDLPTEIITNIGSCLPFYSRFELSNTCRRFKIIVTQHCLYQDILLNENPAKTRRIIRKFKHNQFNGNQVKRLNITLSHLTSQLYRRLPTIFPNIACLISSMGNEGQRDDFLIEPMKQWMNKLEEYDMSKGQLQLDRLITANVFSRIHSLTLSPLVDILSCLINVPSLKHLHLFKFELDIEFLELMHSKCPSLNSFKLSCGFICMVPDKELPRDIGPLPALSSLVLEKDISFSDEKCLFLDYISMKYTQLKHFEYRCIFNNSRIERQMYSPHGIHRRNVPREVFTVQEFMITRDKYSQEGGFKLLAKLPTTINKLILEITAFADLYAGLIQSGLNPLEIQFIDSNRNSIIRDEVAQLEYICKLGNLKKLTTAIDEEVNPFTRKCKSNSLETLHLTIRKRDPRLNEKHRNDFDITTVLFCFPSLKSFSLEGNIVGLSTQDTYASRRSYPNLRILNLKRCLTVPAFLTFLASHAVGIEYFDYSMSKLVKAKGRDKGQALKTYTIHLPNHRLKTIRLSQLHLLRNTARSMNFSLYVEVKAGYTTGKYILEFGYDDKIINVKDVTKPTIDLTVDVVDLTDLPEENENLTKIIITLRDLKTIKFKHYSHHIPLHNIPPQPTLIDDD